MLQAGDVYETGSVFSNDSPTNSEDVPPTVPANGIKKNGSTDRPVLSYCSLQHCHLL